MKNMGRNGGVWMTVQELIKGIVDYGTDNVNKNSVGKIKQNERTEQYVV